MAARMFCLWAPTAASVHMPRLPQTAEMDLTKVQAPSSSLYVSFCFLLVKTGSHTVEIIVKCGNTKNFIIFIYLYVSLCEYLHAPMGAHEAEESIQSLGVEAMGSCELPSMGGVY